MNEECDRTELRLDDERPNSGLREGEISHADVNDALRAHLKTVIFGQQTRLRDGVLLEDEKLARFHAGHDLVRFFYGGVRQLPEYLVDALLAWGVSVTLVRSEDLLVFRHAREHQSFHTGRTRKTIYMPELVIEEARAKGYDYWAISEVIIQESWPLLDYHLLIELIRRAQQHFRQYYTLGHAFVYDQLMELNKHRKFSDREPDNEFNEFFAQYSEPIFDLDRDQVLVADPFALVDEFFDEVRERKWASEKRTAIRNALNYPTYYNIDRDIVHPTAFRISENRAMTIVPETIDEILHDMEDALRFEVGVQIKTDRYIDMLIERGEPGISGFSRLGWNEGTYFGTGYYPLVEFTEKIQAFSTSPPEGAPGSISRDFKRLMRGKEQQVHDWYCDFWNLPFRRKRFLVLKLADLAGMADLKQLVFEVENALRYSNDDEALLKGLADIFYDHYLQLDRVEADFNTYLLGQILMKLDLHPRYREVYVPQYEHLVGGRELVVGEDLRPQVDELAELIPDKALRLSSDPQRLRLCLQRFEELRRSNPGSAELLELLAGIFLRLDRSDKYRELLAALKNLGEVADRVGAEIVAQIGAKDQVRADILSAVQDLLQEQERLGVRRAEDKEWEWPSLVESLYRLLGMEGVEERGQPLHLYLRQDQLDNKDVLRGLVERGSEIPAAHRAIITLLFTGK